MPPYCTSTESSVRGCAFLTDRTPVRTEEVQRLFLLLRRPDTGVVPLTAGFAPAMFDGGDRYGEPAKAWAARPARQAGRRPRKQDPQRSPSAIPEALPRNPGRRGDHGGIRGGG